MQQFIKMRKQVSMTESTRLVLNKSIDLLHKLSNGKLGKEEVKKEITILLSTYYVTVHPESGHVDSPEKKLKLEHFLNQAYEIAEQVESGKVPLYEAIMLMNKVVVSLKPNESESEEENRVQTTTKAPSYPAEREVIRFRPVEKQTNSAVFDEVALENQETNLKVADRFELRKPERQSQNEDSEVTELISDVLKQKKALENSISHLNQSLSKIGFELRPIK